jgi:uncharacterized phage protein (TIGR01671 family)
VEYLFRGKRVDGNNNWVYGCLLSNGKKSFIIIPKNIRLGNNNSLGNTSVQEVIPETVGQYTGLKDKNESKIFEGDIVKLGDSKLQVIYQAPSFVMKKHKRNKTWHTFILAASERQFCEVIGSIHDNPELIN